MKTLDEAQKQRRQIHYLLTCPYCSTKLVTTQDELHMCLFEPKEVEEESEKITYEVGDDGKLKEPIKFEKVKEKVLRSSNPDKDIYKDIKCCYCGHIWDEPVKDMSKRRCNPDGQQTQVFELDEVETERAREFMKKHSHKEEFRARNKFGFSTLGQQFTYEITPGGLGCGVTIICNQCQESKDITNTDNW